MDLNKRVDISKRWLTGFLLGMVVMCAIALGINALKGGTREKALENYARCLQDGGTSDHCLNRYFIGIEK